MNHRTEFAQKIKVAVIKRATTNGQVYCEKCLMPAKKWQVDHVIADSHGGKAVIENAELICEVCYGVKNPQDTKIAAKIKRQEAKALMRPAKKVEIKGKPFAPTAAKDRSRPEKATISGGGRYILGVWTPY
jgi:hypothetical protein